VEIRIGNDRLACHFVEGDILRGELRCCGNRQAVANALRVTDRPLQCLHAAEAATNHRRPGVDAQLVGQ